MRRTVQGIVIDFAELSDPGRDENKQVNEDSSAYTETPHGHLAVVCDGMGGHLLGQEASQLAIREIIQIVNQIPPGNRPREILRRALETAAASVYQLGSDAPSGARPGATCVSVLIHPGGLYVAHVGDSRCYLVRDSGITRLTRDHSVVQELVDAGIISQEAAANHPNANQITRALGTNINVEIEVSAPIALKAKDCLLLCSDGLSDLISDAELERLVSRGIATGPAVVCQQLVDLANQRGGHDNITVQLIEVIEAPAAQATPLPTALDMKGHTLHAELGDLQQSLQQSASSHPEQRGHLAQTLHGSEPYLDATQTLVDPLSEHPSSGTTAVRSGHTQILEPLSPTLTEELSPRTERGPSARLEANNPVPSLPQASLRAPGAGRNLVTIAAVLASVILFTVVGWWLLGGKNLRERREPNRPFAPWVDAGAGQPVIDQKPLELKPDTDAKPDATPSAKPSSTQSAPEIPSAPPPTSLDAGLSDAGRTN